GPGGIAVLAKRVVKRLKTVPERTDRIGRPSRSDIRVKDDRYRSVVVAVLPHRGCDMSVEPGAGYPCHNELFIPEFDKSSINLGEREIEIRRLVCLAVAGIGE